MSREKTDVPAPGSPKVLKATDPGTIKLIHEYLDRTKGKRSDGKLIDKLRRFVRKPNKPANSVAENVYAFTNSKNEKIQIAVDESVLVFNAENPKTRQLYVLKNKIGAGAFGRVKNLRRMAEFDMVNLKTGHENVIKIISYAKKNQKNPLNRPLEEEVIQEALLEKELGASPGFMLRESESLNKIYIILPKHPGKELFDHYEQQSITEVDEKLEVAIKILEQLKARFHNKGYIHRDLKPENIMYDQFTKELNIIDLGMVAKAQKLTLPKDILGCGTLYAQSDFLKGTEGYIAPESERYSIYSEKTDVFSVGRIFATALQLSSQIGFKMAGDTIADVYATNTSGDSSSYRVSEEEAKLGKVGAEALKQLVLAMNNKKANDRIGVDEALKRLKDILKLRADKIKALEKEREEAIEKAKERIRDEIEKTRSEVRAKTRETEKDTENHDHENRKISSKSSLRKSKNIDSKSNSDKENKKPKGGSPFKRGSFL